MAGMSDALSGVVVGCGEAGRRSVVGGGVEEEEEDEDNDYAGVFLGWRGGSGHCDPASPWDGLIILRMWIGEKDSLGSAWCLRWG